MGILELLIVVLLILWLTGHFVFALGDLVHLVLVIALIVFAVRLVRGHI